MADQVGLELVDHVPAVALAIYAHPDDAEVACGGTLATWAEQGCAVHILVAARGDKGTSDPTVDPAALCGQRRAEMERASEALGVSSRIHLDFEDGEVEATRDLRRLFVGEVRRLRPDAVVCPDPTAVFFGQEYVNHRDHRQTGWAALDAVAPASALPHYFPDSGAAHQVGVLYLSGTLQPDVAVDITSTLERKIAALSCHRSQVGPSSEWLEELVFRRAEEAGRSAGVRHAETYRRQYLAN